MITMLAALLAVSLSSSDLDEFFTLPSWLSDSANKENTPGSDPNNEEDSWYVMELTNGYVRAGWKIYNRNNPEEPILDFDQPENGHGAWLQKRAPTRLDPPQEMFDSVQLYPYPIIADEDADRLQWHQLYFKDGVMFFSYEFIADRILNPTNLPSGRFKPKAHRLSTAIQSGVLSTFAGYCEREYYAIQAQTNGWEQGDRWPQINKRIFRFESDAFVVTNFTTNVIWEAEATVGTNNYKFVDVDIKQASSNYWNCYAVGKLVANKLGAYITIYMNPMFFIDTMDGKTGHKIEGESELKYISDNIHTTNFSFKAIGTDDVVTNINFYYGNEFTYNPTNRIIGSRRLNQYDNIDILADFMINSWSYVGFINLSSYRPSTNIVLMYDSPTKAITNTVEYTTWHHGALGQRDNMWWASTEDNVFNQSDPMLPTFNWTRDPTSNTSLWNRCCQTFRCLDFDEIWYPWRYSIDSYVQSVPTKMLLDEVCVSSYTNSTVDCRPCLIPVTMRQLIETNFPHADGWAITNDTRRLISERLCCMNQALSLMDRTYHVPDIHYPMSYTNIYAQEVSEGSFVPVTNIVKVSFASNFVNRAMYTGTVNVNYVHDQYDSLKIVFDEGSESWDECVLTNFEYESESNHRGSFIKKDVSRTITNTDVKHGIALGSFVAYEDDVIDLFRQITQDQGPGNYYFDILGSDYFYYDSFSRELFGKVIVYVTKFDFFNPVEYGIYADLCTIPYEFPISMSYTRSYSYDRTTEHPKFGLTQPGWQGDTDMSSSSYGSMTGLYFSTNDYEHGYSIYKSNTDSYKNRQSLEVALINVTDEAYEKFECEYGINPLNWSEVIPIDMTDVLFVRDSITNRSANVTVVPNGFTTHGMAYCDYDSIVISNVFTYSQGRVQDGWGAGLIVDALYDYDVCLPRQKERNRLKMIGRIGFITRTDWNWKTLKRGND